MVLIFFYSNELNLVVLTVGILIFFVGLGIRNITKINGNQFIHLTNAIGFVLFKKIVNITEIKKISLHEEQDFITGKLIPTLLIETPKDSIKLKRGWSLEELEFIKKRIEESLNNKSTSHPNQ